MSSFKPWGSKSSKFPSERVCYSDHPILVVFQLFSVLKYCRVLVSWVAKLKWAEIDCTVLTDCIHHDPLKVCGWFTESMLMCLSILTVFSFLYNENIQSCDSTVPLYCSLSDLLAINKPITFIDVRLSTSTLLTEWGAGGDQIILPQQGEWVRISLNKANWLFGLRQPEGSPHAEEKYLRKKKQTKLKIKC